MTKRRFFPILHAYDVKTGDLVTLTLERGVTETRKRAIVLDCDHGYATVQLCQIISAKTGKWTGQKLAGWLDGILETRTESGRVLRYGVRGIELVARG